MRKFESVADSFTSNKNSGGSVTCSIGQEAVLSGMREAIRPTDRVILAYRDHAHPLCWAPTPSSSWPRCMARRQETSKGKGSSDAHV